MIVDCWVGDGPWAVANLKNIVPTPYLCLTMGGHHTVFVSKITNAVIKTMMAPDGRHFCEKESLHFIWGLFSDVVKQIEDHNPQDVPEDDEDDVSVQSDEDDERAPKRQRAQ